MQKSNPMSSSGYQGAAIILITLGVFMAAILITLSANGGSGTNHPSDAGEADLGHVHGLGVDPNGDRLYIATHTGVFTLEDKRLTRVADRYQDTMGFAVIGPRHFLASGHPDLREDLPSHLGLIESVDGAETWTAQSLQGEADLHLIEPTDSRLYAYDSASGSLIASEDRREWEVIDTRPIVDLAAGAADGQAILFATSPDGELLRYEQGQRSPSLVAGAPPLAYIDWARADLLGGVTLAGEIFISESGEAWRSVGSVDGPIVALDATPGVWHVATEAGVYASTDNGQTWTLMLGIE
jgi:hypothetical protein